MLKLLFSISFWILSKSSSIEFLLSSNDETDIFKLVISKFKSSIYFWLSLLSSANSFITTFRLSICLDISSTSCSFSSLVFILTSFCCTILFSSSLSFSNLACAFDTASSNESIFWFSVAYTTSISCNSFSNLAVSSITSVIEAEYFSFSSVIEFILLFSFSISFAKSSISLLLPNIFTVFLATEPPVIAPDGFMISPSNVTTLNV